MKGSDSRLAILSEGNSHDQGSYPSANSLLRARTLSMLTCVAFSIEILVHYARSTYHQSPPLLLEHQHNVRTVAVKKSDECLGGVLYAFTSAPVGHLRQGSQYSANWFGRGNIVRGSRNSSAAWMRSAVSLSMGLNSAMMPDDGDDFG